MGPYEEINMRPTLLGSQVEQGIQSGVPDVIKPKMSAAILPIVLELFKSGFNWLSERKTNKERVELARLQNNLNLAQWNRENEYNSPRSQMQRYVDAGINPNFAVAQPNLSANSPDLSSGYESIQSPELEYNSLAVAQANKLDSETALNNVKLENETQLTSAQIERFRVENDLSYAQIKTMERTIQQIDSTIELNRETVKKLQKEIEVLDEDKASKAIQNTIDRALMESTIAAQFEKNRTVVETAYRQAMADLTNTQADTKLKYSYMRLNAAQRAEALALGGFYLKMMRGQGLQNGLTEYKLNTLLGSYNSWRYSDNKSYPLQIRELGWAWNKFYDFNIQTSHMFNLGANIGGLLKF